MNSDLELLLKLQVIDYDKGELERSKEYLPDMMENLTREITETKQKLEDSSTELDECRLKQKNTELDISTSEANLQKFQQQMMSIKTNKEYDALVSEIDHTKQAISSAETELLETIDRISELEKEIVDLTEKQGKVNENNDKQLKVLQEKIDSIGDKLQAKDKEREKIKVTVPRQTLTVYERVRRGKGGDVVVVVKRRACGACYKSLTPKKVQTIKKAEGIHTCDACGRMLFWDNDISN